ncbi:MAG: DEAD/DEAH box helicase [Gemmatimonas sp.]
MGKPFALKPYQRQCLSTLQAYLADVDITGDANTAFYKLTRRAYNDAPALPGMPYVCLRVPTGGGKTVLAAHSIGVAADTLLKTDTPSVLWLVPSQTILEQTLATLLDRTHANRRALAERFGENVRVMSITDALYAKRAEYDGGACVIVSTLQAFRRDDTEGLKVYSPNGELMDHFAGLTDAERGSLEKGPSGDPVPSLANVIRLRRPVIIVDEAHNARTPLSFDVLARLSPALIIEFTATPVTPDKADPARGVIPSNVLHQVSAAELKAAEMIKLPVILRGRADRNDTISDAIGWLDHLASVARDEERDTGEFIRPIMLVQAERRSKTEKTLHAQELKKLLVEDFRQPAEAIAIATGEVDELENVNLFARDCPIRFIVTQSKLREGWDCSFAYVLCSVAEQKSATAVEQILGRVLRMPNAMRKKHEELNRAYAFATTTSFHGAASALKDGLVSNGFERIEAENLVHASQDQLPGIGDGGTAYVHEEQLPVGLNLAAIRDFVETATSGRVRVDTDTGRIMARGALSDVDHSSLIMAVTAGGGTERDYAWSNAFVHKTRGARLAARAENDRRFVVPQLVIRRDGMLSLFDRSHFLDIPWALETCDPAPVLSHFAPPSKQADEAHIDVSSQGKATVSFVEELQQQLALSMEERNWTMTALTNWVDRALPKQSRLDITKASSTRFIGNALKTIMSHYGVSLDEVARAKFRVVDAVANSIQAYREQRERDAFDDLLQVPRSDIEFLTSEEFSVVFDEARYSYNHPYRGPTVFQKHISRIVGDLDVKGEEHDCAVYIDRLTSVKLWVRNTVKQPNSFSLQTASDRFYPDFVCELDDGRILVVEYKGQHIASDPGEQQKKLVGELWARRSRGRCLFAWVEDRAYQEIDRVIAGGSSG